MVQVIAEIGCNHMGDLAVAKEMVTVAARVCKADVAKFQKRSNRELLTAEQYAGPHPVPANAYGATYGEHREKLEFTPEQHQELQAHCAAEGIGYSTSVWDLTSARQMAALAPSLLKIPSASNLNWAMQDWLARNYGGEIHLSVGMTTREEVEEIVHFYEVRDRARDVVLYACTSAYPVSFDDICLREITALKDRYDGRVKAIGFSGHHLGIAADVGAVALGAEWIERHFTLDRTWKGTDHAASLEPDGLRRLVRDVAAVSRALSYKSSDLLPVEIEQRRKLKWQRVDEAAA
ncbi:N-acetylneuraminate synthase family protein [Sphingomonas sp. ID0503]|uniref:N-acetylneuraminate synthase family protein n=1 Tax=Sphingomonas sp. ID0503 TaxID=3399691 RepID=UPI003AFA5BBD